MLAAALAATACSGDDGGTSGPEQSTDSPGVCAAAEELLSAAATGDLGIYEQQLKALDNLDAHPGSEPRPADWIIDHYNANYACSLAAAPSNPETSDSSTSLGAQAAAAFRSYTSSIVGIHALDVAAPCPLSASSPIEPDLGAGLGLVVDNASRFYNTDASNDDLGEEFRNTGPQLLCSFRNPDVSQNVYADVGMAALDIAPTPEDLADIMTLENGGRETVLWPVAVAVLDGSAEAQSFTVDGEGTGFVFATDHDVGDRETGILWWDANVVVYAFVNDPIIDVSRAVAGGTALIGALLDGATRLRAS